MLDIGFLPAIKRIISACPKTRQTLLFSATMPKEIESLSRQHLHNPERIAVAAVSKTADKIEQGVIHVTSDDKISAIVALLKQHREKQTIVFTRTKRGADRVVRRLENEGLAAAAIHGNKSQNQRERALGAFREGKCPVLVATDIAARGIDVPGIGLVINFELPNVPEVYVHRIGRTARAERDGLAISFCDPEEQYYLRDIQRLIKLEIPMLDAPEGVKGLATPNLENARKPKIVQQQRPPRRDRPAKPKVDKRTSGGGAKPPAQRRRRPNRSKQSAGAS
jgi:ATP-dependent RNA helicase RhlE